MAPRGSVRRGWRALVVTGSVVVLVMQLAGAATGLSSTTMGQTASTGRAGSAIGEPGSGEPAWPVVYPRRARGELVEPAITFTDLDERHSWARKAITWVAASNDWMRDYQVDEGGLTRFRPNQLATRKHFARSLMRAFAPDAVADPEVSFPDVDPTTRWQKPIAIAVTSGWIKPMPDGTFAPDDPVTVIVAHRALALILGLKPAAKAIGAIHTADGDTFSVPGHVGTTMLGLRLGLRYNFPTGSETNDVGPTDPLPRAYMAYSLWRATTLPDGAVDTLLTQYAEVELPRLTAKKMALVQWGLDHVGFPYYWGGEWGIDVPGQSRPGFDCSGLTWWLLRRDDVGWEVSPPRPYAGWALPERTSAEMARMTTDRLRYRELRPGDMMFYDGSGDGVVDHVDTYIGNGWALDSSSTPGGVTVMWVGDGWYREHFTHGRRVIG